MSMQLQVQNLINKINEKEKLHLDQEKEFSALSKEIMLLESRSNKVETKLKYEGNVNVNLRT